MHLFAPHHRARSHAASAAETQGRVLNGGWTYDLGTWFLDTVLLRGKLRELRERTMILAGIQPGDKVLDVGCGTGTLAIEIQARVGETGSVSGVDPGAQQIVRARSKAARRHLAVDFRVGAIERLPFPDQSFDAVVSTLMMHHLPDDLKRRGLAETARVLKPGGRLVIADFKRPEDRPGRAAHLGSGMSGIQDLPALVKNAGFSRAETQEMRLSRFSPLPHIGFLKAYKD